MTDQRPPGNVEVYWDEKRKRFIAEKTVGYDARGNKIKCFGYGKNETAALPALARRLRDYEAGHPRRALRPPRRRLIWPIVIGLAVLLVAVSSVGGYIYGTTQSVTEHLKRVQ